MVFATQGLDWWWILPSFLAHLVIDLGPEEHKEGVGGEEEQPGGVQRYKRQDLGMYMVQGPSERHHPTPCCTPTQQIPLLVKGTLPIIRNTLNN